MDYMNLALKFQEAEERGEARGRLEGKLEAILEMAKNFLDILDDKTIAMKTGLSVDKVEELRKEQEKSK